MARYRIFLALLLAAPLALSQQAARGSIQGTVLNAATGLPISDAFVELTGIDQGRVKSYTETTRTGGAFSFTGLPPDDAYQIVVSAEGYRTAAHGQSNTDEPWVAIPLAAGQHLRDVQISLHPISFIRGKISDSQGKPLQGATVFAMRTLYEAGRMVLQSVQSTVTTVRGEYRLSGLPAGSYFIRVAARNTDSTADVYLMNPSAADRAPVGRRTSVSREPEGYPLIYYPGTLLQSARAINLADGNFAENVDVAVPRVRTGRVRGGVVGENGKPVPAGRIQMVLKGESPESNWTRHVELKDGQFDLRAVYPGSYVLTASVGSNDSRLWGRVGVEVGEGEVRTIAVPVAPPASITGSIAIENWEGPSDPDLSTLSITLAPSSTERLDGGFAAGRTVGGSVNAAAGPNGAFVLHGVPPGSYRILLSENPSGSDPRPLRGAYVKRIALGAAEMPNPMLEVDGHSSEPLEIRLSTASGTLDGRIVDEQRQNVPLARAVLVPADRSRLHLYLTAQAGSTGRFQMQGIAPGDYKVFSGRRFQDGAWQDPDFLARYENLGAPVHIEEGNSEYVEVTQVH